LPLKMVAIVGVLLIAGAVIVWTLGKGKTDGTGKHTVFTVVTEPTQVSVFVGNERNPRGTTDANGELRLSLDPDKQTALTLQREYFEKRTLLIDPQASRVKIRLDRTKCDVAIRTTPGNATVFVDGSPVGQTDSSGKLLLKGVEVLKTVKISVKKDGFPEVTREVTIASTDTFTIEDIILSSASMPAGVTIKVHEPDAEVFIDSGKGFRSRGKTDPKGEMVLTDLPKDTPVRTKIVKPGWQEAVPEPIVLSRDEKTMRVLEVRLNRSIADLALVTEPPGVRIQVDGSDAGETGTDGSIEIKGLTVVSPHSLSLTKPGYEAKTVEVVVPADHEGKVFKLPEVCRLGKIAPREIEVSVRTQPPQVQVHIDGKPDPVGVSDDKGHLPLRLPDSEELTLAFKKEGFEPVSQKFRPDKDNKTISVTLTPDKCDLRVRTDPSGVSVSLQGTPIGVSDAEGKLLISGKKAGTPMALIFEKRGYQRLSLTLTPERGQTDPTPVKLTKLDQDSSRGLAESIHNPRSPLEIAVKAHSNVPRFKMGEEVAIFVTASADCYVTVLMVGAGGTAMVLYPTVADELARIRKGERLRIPPESAPKILASPPAGETYIKAIATAAPLFPDLLGFLKPHGPYAQLKDSVAGLRFISQRLGKMNANDWGSSELVVEEHEE
jgi:hypothetical protein